jgi:chromosome segregation protein
MVHLHSVRLRGFKSFAKPTELTFEPGVTVIIGPNGSGKSNIADAVLWVLGEQSAGNLRGRSMQDVIFSGAGGRKSSAVAEVSLVFDDGGGSLPLGYQELEVTRRLTRDTGSEYRLNGSGCRLLDIQDLVGGLGLGREMHSVVSQGKVEALLNSTPEARRALVEEAAGLARFRKRRERAQTKLERTRQNLVRAADIEREVKAALRPLRQQVAAAERFAEATEEWALAKSRLVLHALVGVRASGTKIGEELERARFRREQLEAALADLRRQRAADEERFNAVLEERESLSSAYHQARAGADYLEARTASLRQRLVRIEGELDRARRRWDLAQSDAVSLGVRVGEMGAETSDQSRLRRVTGWAEALRSELESSLPAYRAAVADEDDLKDAVFELEAARSRALQDREFLRREVEERGRTRAQLAALVSEGGSRLEQAQAEVARVRERLGEAEKALRLAQVEMERAAAGRAEARDRAERVARTEAALGEESAGLESRLAILSDVLTRREGTPAGARQLLDVREGYRPLTELLNVEPGYERAVAAALGPLIEAVVVPAGMDLTRVFGAEGALEAISESEDPSVVASPVPGVPMAGALPDVPAGMKALWDIVSGPGPVMTTLQRLIVPTAILVDGDRLDGDVLDVDSPWRMVSRSGEVLQGAAHAARRQDVGAESLLRARNELEAASRERAALLRQRDAVREEAAQAAAAAKEADDLHRRREEALRQAEHGLAALRGETDLLERRVEEARLQRSELLDRDEREAAAADGMLAELQAVEVSVGERERELEEARADLRAHQDRVEVLRRAVGGLESKKSQAALVEVRLRERCRSQESERARVRGQWEGAQLEARACERRVQALDRYLPVLAELLDAGGLLAERTRSAATELGQRVEAVRATSEGTARGLRDRGGEEAALQSEQETLGARSADLRVELARLEDRRTLLEEELAELRRRHQSPRGLTPADVAGEDVAILEAAVERAERRRERIGPINPLAEVECAELEERAGFLAEQRRDLEASLGQLEDVIGELDEHIDRSFTEIFEATREHFAAVTASVFPGAKGTLRLTEPKAPDRGSGVGEEGDDEREQAPGIAIEVKFPNKAPRSLSLLSGGEKAMTAIAFLFSLFLARPCPFYILDEVEASLDDINIRRFLSLVRKYRDRTQFIIITHQRQTMEVADTLYGVTLESDGTSRVLSRRLAIAKGA